uniref:Uncharacterized protein n=1 Tax=Ditylenchus dipsaci TaxID=166011 RepID=A0A915DYD6_9BILA
MLIHAPNFGSSISSLTYFCALRHFVVIMLNNHSTFCRPFHQNETKCAEEPEWSTENLFQVFNYFPRPHLEHIPLVVGNRQLVYFLQRHFGTAPYRRYDRLNIVANSSGTQLAFQNFNDIDEQEVAFEFLKNYKSVLFGIVNIVLTPGFNGDHTLFFKQLICLTGYWQKSVLVVTLLKKHYDDYGAANKEKYERLLDQILRSTIIMSSPILYIDMHLGKMAVLYILTHFCSKAVNLILWG